MRLIYLWLLIDPDGNKVSRALQYVSRVNCPSWNPYAGIITHRVLVVGNLYGV
jgi:hypothetical protein